METLRHGSTEEHFGLAFGSAEGIGEADTQTQKQRVAKTLRQRREGGGHVPRRTAS